VYKKWQAQDTRTTGVLNVFTSAWEMMTAEALSGAIPETDAYVKLSLLDGGSFVGETGKLHAGVSNVKFRMYNWAFYISHQGRHVLWDLGLDEVCD
jgi:hypothetical protein